MSESAYICVNCKYTDSLGISFSLLFPSDQSCVSNSMQSTVCYPYLSTQVSMTRKKTVQKCQSKPDEVHNSQHI